jgi:hypothetical protein
LPAPGSKTATPSTSGDQAKWRSNVGAGLVMDTMVGAALIGVTAGFDGRWRTFVGVGRVFQ